MEQRLKEASQEESQRRETRELAGRRNRSPEVVLDSEEESRTASLSLPHRSTPKTYAHRHKKRRHSRSLSPSRSHSRQESPQKVPRIDFKSECAPISLIFHAYSSTDTDSKPMSLIAALLKVV